MIIMDQETSAIHLYLKSRSLHVSKDWLEGCVSFFRSENATGYGRAQLEEFVLEQWKLADLREMGEVCLPPNLCTKVKVMLPGNYSLQVESMLDIAAPCYSQLQKIRKVATENLDVSEIKAQTWEPRPTRMLRLMLSDGMQEIMGIEYRPIRKLDQRIVPGCKVLVIGPVECRKGVVLLQEQNLQIIGGEVDSLLIPNALENLLARKLHLEENPQPYINSLTPPEVPLPAAVATQPVAPVSVTHPNRPVAQVAPMASQASHDFNEDEDLFHCEELDEIEKRYQQELDDVPENMMNCEVIDVPDNLPGSWNVCGRPVGTSGRGGNSTVPATVRNRGSISMESEQLQRNSCSVSTNNRALSVGRNPQTVCKPNAQKNYLNCQHPYLQLAGTNVTRLETNSFGSLNDFEVYDFEETRYSNKAGPSTNNPSVCIVDLLEEDDELLLDISSQDLDASVLQEEPTVSTNTKLSSSNKATMKQATVTVGRKPAQRNQSKITSFISKNQNRVNVLSGVEGTSKTSVVLPTGLKRPPSSPVKSKVSGPHHEIFSEQKKCKSTSGILSESKLPPKTQGRLFDVSLSDRVGVQASDKFAVRVDDSVKQCVASRGVEHSVGCDGLPSETLHPRVPLLTMEKKPFVYLSQILPCPRSTETVYTVKAFVLTLVSQLVLKKEGWHLLCKINDGSAVMEVTFASKVLEKLIGYSPAEIRVLRHQMATNPAVKEKIKGVLLDAQKKLVNLSCLMDLTFSNTADVPMVTDINEVCQEHVDLLERRVSVLSRPTSFESGSA